MKWSYSSKRILVYVMISVLTLVYASTAAAADKIGIFQKIVEADGDFAETTATLEQSIANSSLELLGKMDIAVPDDAQKCRTYVLTSPAFNQAAMGSLSPDAISALVLRIGVYEADGKVHVNIANPDALANVYFEGESARDSLMAASSAAKKELIQVIQAVEGKVVNAQQEPVRKAKKYRGYNGDGPAKMMAKFRDFRESLLTAKEADGSTSLDQIIDEIKNNAAASLQADAQKGWKVVAAKKFSDKAAWVGITNIYTETKCVNINSDFRFGDKTDNNRYPGVDHAPAMPLEVVIYKGDNGKWQVAQYGEMWRMQLYFWDSGYAAFAKNTLIPSIIFSDIESMIKGN
jgi:uncharacterized protein (DUF302 family)